MSKEVEEKFDKAAEDKKKASSALPQWGEVYHLGDWEKFHKARKVNESFSCLLHKTVSSSGSLSLSLDDLTMLEACIRGQIESQSISLWALASTFEFLKESNCVLNCPVIHLLVCSMMTSINSHAGASFLVAAFLKQKRREILVSHLPASTHASVKLAFLATPSLSSLSEDVIKEPLMQAKGRCTNQTFVKSFW